LDERVLAVVRILTEMASKGRYAALAACVALISWVLVAEASSLAAHGSSSWPASFTARPTMLREPVGHGQPKMRLRGGGEALALTEDGGVTKEILVEGTGEELPHTHDDVCVHYVGTLQSDGSQFDSSRDRQAPFTFKLGQGKVIKGWDVGVATMKRGEKSILTIRSDYAYGPEGSGDKIPGNATLIFEVELLRWNERDVTADGGVFLKPKDKKGTGCLPPSPSRAPCAGRTARRRHAVRGRVHRLRTHCVDPGRALRVAGGIPTATTRYSCSTRGAARARSVGRPSGENRLFSFGEVEEEEPQQRRAAGAAGVRGAGRGVRG